MKVLLDTSVVIDVLRGVPQALDYARGLDDIPTCSEITRVEIMRGVRSAERRRTERLFSVVHWMELTEAISRRASNLGRTFRRTHAGLATADLVIAATALEAGLSIATRNVRHFPMFPRLAPPYVV
jgi:predicted nucleic acid-binding protein